MRFQSWTPENYWYTWGIFWGRIMKALCCWLCSRMKQWDQNTNQRWWEKHSKSGELYISLSSWWTKILKYKYRTRFIWALQKNKSILCWNILYYWSRENQKNSHQRCNKLHQLHLLKNLRNYFWGFFWIIYIHSWFPASPINVDFS